MRGACAFLLIGLLCTIIGKYAALRGPDEEAGAALLLLACLADASFIAASAAAMLLFHACLRNAWGVRAAILIGASVATWACANTAWLLGTGTQMHVSVLISLVRSPLDFGSIVLHGLLRRPALFAATCALGLAAAASLAWCLRHARPGEGARRTSALRALLAAVVAGGLAQASVLSRDALKASPQVAAASYSSHWFALATVFGARPGMRQDNGMGRHIARAGERALARVQVDEPTPHVVMVLMESTGHWATSLGGQPPGQTPALVRLASRGLHFANTRAVVTHTTPSQFSILTGVSPSLDGGFKEAVLVDRPYESLATVLGAAGYRTRFVQMAKATFECNPGLVANLGFESFWSRENLQDPGAHLGYFSGDDFRMIEPAFEWLDRQPGPCFLVLMTSMAHHPYDVPARYGAALQSPLAAYLRSVRVTDTFVGAVARELEIRDLFADTLLCVTSDHGESLGQHGVLQHNAVPYEEGVRVPWLMTWPRRLGAGTIEQRACSLMDVTPTILSVLGYDISRAAFDGHDARARNAAVRPMRTFGWGRAAPATLLVGHEKTIHWPAPGKAFRYDLSDDPQEQSPTALTAAATERLGDDLNGIRAGSRISFAPRRYRRRLLYGRWETFCLGEFVWCYYSRP